MKIITWNFHRGQIFVRHGFTQANVAVYTAEKELEPLETNTQTKSNSKTNELTNLSSNTKERKKKTIGGIHS